MIFAKNKERVREFRATKYKKMWRENILAHAHPGCESTEMVYTSQKWNKKNEIIH